MAEFILKAHRPTPAERVAEAKKAEDMAAAGDFIETVRWIRFKPQFRANGDLVGVDIDGVTKTPPKDQAGPTVKVTFKVPKRIFGPIANVTVDLDTAAFDGTPEIVAQQLKDLRDSLK